MTDELAAELLRLVAMTQFLSSEGSANSDKIQSVQNFFSSGKVIDEAKDFATKSEHIQK